MKRVANNHITLMSGERRPLETVMWGIVLGACQVVDGLVSILSLGFVLTDLSLSAAYRMSLAESRREKAGA